MARAAASRTSRSRVRCECAECGHRGWRAGFAQSLDGGETIGGSLPFERPGRFGRLDQSLHSLGVCHTPQRTENRDLHLEVRLRLERAGERARGSRTFAHGETRSGEPADVGRRVLERFPQRHHRVRRPELAQRVRRSAPHPIVRMRQELRQRNVRLDGVELPSRSAALRATYQRGSPSMCTSVGVPALSRTSASKNTRRSDNDWAAVSCSMSASAPSSPVRASTARKSSRRSFRRGSADATARKAVGFESRRTAAANARRILGIGALRFARHDFGHEVGDGDRFAPPSLDFGHGDDLIEQPRGDTDGGRGIESLEQRLSSPPAAPRRW